MPNLSSGDLVALGQECVAMCSRGVAELPEESPLLKQAAILSPSERTVLEWYCTGAAYGRELERTLGEAARPAELPPDPVAAECYRREAEAKRAETTFFRCCTGLVVLIALMFVLNFIIASRSDQLEGDMYLSSSPAPKIFAGDSFQEGRP